MGWGEVSIHESVCLLESSVRAVVCIGLTRAQHATKHSSRMGFAPGSNSETRF
jgi:hypothetical protein